MSLPQLSQETLDIRKTFRTLVDQFELDLPLHRVLNYDIEWITKYGPNKNPGKEHCFQTLKELFE